MQQRNDPLTNAASTTPDVVLRPAADADSDAIAELWHRGWRDGHLGHVPAALLDHRHLRHFQERVPARLATTTVATLDGRIVGFVTTDADEVEQLYVDAAARGTGIADLLLRRGETVIAAGSERAWLAVAAGNIRARRFYERNGWSDTGPFDYPAEGADGTTVSVPVRRYEKRLAAHFDGQ
jgi:ribosomal protein S18 acetylase RimI-like enzyme